jgi:hypothetical protein
MYVKEWAPYGRCPGHGDPDSLEGISIILFKTQSMMSNHAMNQVEASYIQDQSSKYKESESPDAIVCRTLTTT